MDLRVAGVAVVVVAAFGAADAVAQEAPDAVFDEALDQGGAPFAVFDFEVGEGIVEVEVRHESKDADDVVDFGVEDVDGFRGWGGGNVEPAVIGEKAASRSYLPGPIKAGTWHVIIGKAKLVSDAPGAHVEVFLRTTATLPDATDRAPYEPAVLSTTARFYAGDTHVHSQDSGDARPPLDEIADFARGRGLDFVVLTDHNTDAQVDRINDAQARHSDLLFVPGVEFTTYGGHATGFNVTSYVDHKIGLTTTVEEASAGVHAQGALFSINHPVLDLGDVCIGCAWVNEIPSQLDGVEVATGGYDEVGFLFNTNARDFWDALLDDGRHAAPLGGSDDHKAGVDLGAFGSPIGSPVTMVFASELSAAALAQGIRDNRVVIKMENADDAMIDLQTSPERKGDTVAADDVELSAVITGGTGLQARFMKDGFVDGDPVVVDSDPFTLSRTVSAPEKGEERWRVELLKDVSDTSEGHVQVMTGHVWVTKAADVQPDGCAGCGGSGAFVVVALPLLRRRRRAH